MQFATNLTYDATAEFKRTGALVLDTHVVLPNGQHAMSYLNKARLYADPAAAGRLCFHLARRFGDMPVETIVASSPASDLLAHLMVGHLSRLRGRIVHAVIASDSGPGHLAADFINGRGCVIVDGVLTTGGTARRTVERVRQFGGTALGVAALWNRGNVTGAMAGNPNRIASIVEEHLPSWPASECALCRAK